ncbi:hypothetical protein F7725_003772 [Dissostichus mawsoni]|uniref:SAND domain-containing protein n=1 Tax=Dissostichus mawsoni TaxID=36200 RepID=A0A7J5YB75_DISMA|nr:hypothetical protein F7725_003772 [Dissostichus mawsoni]
MYLMEPMDWLGDNELLLFFRRNKTEMSCMENPQTFLRQLRDHDLLMEDSFQKVSRMQSIKKIKNGLYEILDRLESKQPQDIQKFWSCVFKETILNEYPTLRLLRNNLMNGTFQSESERVETEEADEGKRKDVSEDEEEAEKQESCVKKKRKLKNRDVCDEEEEQPGPSSRVTQRKRPSPLKKGEKNDIWNWDLYKSQLPVTCGEKEGILSRKDWLMWFSPSEFERFAGKDSSRNWKMTIKCLDTTLGKLIQCPRKKKMKTRTQTRIHQAAQIFPQLEEMKKERERNRQTPAMTLAGRDLREEYSYCDQMDDPNAVHAGGMSNIFVLEERHQANILRIHNVPCDCPLCKPGSKDLDDEKNDDECFICKTEEEEEFVVCDTALAPSIRNATFLIDGSQWMCTFCVYKANENLYPNESEREAALSRTISQRLLHCQYLLLCLRSADKDQVFASNPCGKKLYQTVGEFVSDVQLIFSNSASYNQGNAGYLAMGNRLKELFDKEFNSVFNISEQTVG